MATGPTPSPPLPGEIPSNQDDRTLAMLCHMGGVVFIFLPLIVWLVKRGDSRFVDDQGKEAVNFQIMMTVIFIISLISCQIYIGYVLAPVVWIATIAFSVMGGLAANQGQVYRYPYSIRLIK